MELLGKWQLISARQRVFVSIGTSQHYIAKLVGPVADESLYSLGQHGIFIAKHKKKSKPKVSGHRKRAPATFSGCVFPGASFPEPPEREADPLTLLSRSIVLRAANCPRLQPS